MDKTLIGETIAHTGTNSMEDELFNFSDHCKKVYDKSLSISDLFQKPIVEGDHDLEASYVILEALEHLLAYSPHEDEKSCTLDFFTSAKAIKHSKALKSCGLLIEKDDTPNPTLLLKYTQTRDTQRRLAHQNQIDKRWNELEKIIKKYPKVDLHNPAEQGAPYVTQRKFLIDARTELKEFIHLFKSKIGCHSFISGLRKLIENQIGNKKTIGWEFDASILTEAVTVKDEGTDNYLEMSVRLLFSFMVMTEVDIETGRDECKGNNDSRNLLTFYIHPDISDQFLDQILIEIPQSKSLDARPAGLIKCSTKIRRNFRGNMDEISKLSMWKDSFCFIL